MARRSKRKTRHPHSRHNKASSSSESSSRSRTLWLFLVVGLLFCWLDVLYILQFVSSDWTFSSSSSWQRQMKHADHSIHSIQAEANNNPDRNMKTRPIQQLESDWKDDELAGKEPILRLLQEATGSQELDPDTVQRIPLARDVADLYGSAPVVLGLETCQQFQQTGDAAEHFVSTAGSFNTGTNLMAELLIANCHMPLHQQKYGARSRGVRWQVLWGKHTPVFDEHFRQTHRTYNDTTTLTANNIFPAVTVRDPFKWAASMCRHSYGAKWKRDDGDDPHQKQQQQHCPNLVEPSNNNNPVNVTVQYAQFEQQHDSLVGFWNDWYRDYVRAPFPRLIVRFEDVIFHPKLVTKTVCECAGGAMNEHQPFKYIVDSAKKGRAHGAEGQKTSYVDALVKYGTEAGRYKGFAAADLEYARQHLDPDLMRLFGYRYPSTTASSLTS